ncbi:MAG: hypothetical protein Q9200_002636, partial [Gallowayella weberi]
MPSTTRKRAAPAEHTSTNPAKKARGANTPAIATTDKQVEVDSASHVNDQSLQADSKHLPGNGELKTAPKGKASKKTTGTLEATQSDTKTAQVATTDDQEKSHIPAIAVTKGRKRVKAEAVVVKEETDGIAEEGTPKKARKGKVPKQEEEAEELNAEATPKKAKGKRKTKEEKEAEAMPLAARTTGLRMFIGAHPSGNAFALFLKSQRKWENPPLQDENRDAFRSNCIEHKFDAMNHILPHGSYLVNLAQEDKDKAKQAYDSFLEDLQRCEALGIKLYNFHPGTTGNAPRPSAIARIASAL